MRCHYEVLGVDKNATADQIKTAYRVLALKWHPDKNLDNQTEANEEFCIIQEAFNVLSNDKERSWYDNHRDEILTGKEKVADICFDITPYLKSTCYTGFGDDKKGFYTVYRNVFKNIAKEDYPYMAEDEPEIPEFGDSQSDFIDKVDKFYSFWTTYNTRKSYTWLDMYDTRLSLNRRQLRFFEKENKKIRIRAKEERSMEVRSLVLFVRKKDKRVIEHTAKLEQKSLENKKKSEESRKRILQAKQQSLANAKETDWCSFTNVEEALEQMEKSLVEEFGESTANDYEENSDEDEELLMQCTSCNKYFKNAKSFMNHEKSKKHKENVKNLQKAEQMISNGGG